MESSIPEGDNVAVTTSLIMSKVAIPPVAVGTVTAATRNGSTKTYSGTIYNVSASMNAPSEDSYTTLTNDIAD